ncbi:MAG: hypothetical protein JXA03_04690 [Bacteroidales bacterium]|nr:hypothetical protein [Bacteroidales bacterium]
MAKRIFNISLAIVVFCLWSCSEQQTEKHKTSGQRLDADTTDATNNFYDNAETILLPEPSITVEGEITNPGLIDLSELPLHTVIVKETLLSENGNEFTGAYRYDGYSLYDILNHKKLQKANEDEFPPIIDLYVQVENNFGEKVYISWGEIYYPNHLHEIIIACRVMRIVPSKTNELWPLPETNKLVVASDLVTERNINSPTRITVKSYAKSIPTQKGLKPLLSPEIKIFREEEMVLNLDKNMPELPEQEYHTIFYGRGRGIHSTQPFYGPKLRDIFSPYFSLNRKNLMEGLFLVVAKDGYRGVFSYSEVMNRNDQSEILLICRPEVEDEGIFRLFPACDFFSDRAIKGITEIYFSNKEQ